MNKALPAIIFALCLVIPYKAFALTIPETSKPPVPALIYAPKNTEILIFHSTLKIG